MNQITRKGLYGFTIIELLISLTIIGIISGLAIPSFAQLISKNTVNVAALDLQKTMTHARNHAITNQVTVIVCPTQLNSKRCLNKRPRNLKWAYGWLSYADLDGDNEFTNRDEMLKLSQVEKNTSVVFNQVGRLRFFADGSARSAGFYLCSSLSEHTQYLRLLHTGRARLSKKLSARQDSICRSKLVK